MKFSERVQSILDNKNAFGQKIKFPRLNKNKYYLIDGIIYQYKGRDVDVMRFETLNGVWKSATRREMSAANIELLGELKQVNSCDVFFKTGKDETLNSVLQRAQISLLGNTKERAAR